MLLHVVIHFMTLMWSGLEVDDGQQLRVSLSTDPIKLRDAIVAKVLQQQQASVRFVGPMGRTPPLLTIAMAAVAAARVRLQQKGADVDVGVLPCAEILRKGATAEDAEGVGTEGAAAPGSRRTAGRNGRRQQNGSNAAGAGAGAGGPQAGRVVYSLRLVPLPAPGPAPSTAAAGSGAGADVVEGAVDPAAQLAGDGQGADS